MNRDYFAGVDQTIARRGTTQPPEDAETLADVIARINGPVTVMLDFGQLAVPA